jgi:hypothetical protein
MFPVFDIAKTITQQVEQAVETIQALPIEKELAPPGTGTTYAALPGIIEGLPDLIRQDYTQEEMVMHLKPELAPEPTTPVEDLPFAPLDPQYIFKQYQADPEAFEEDVYGVGGAKQFGIAGDIIGGIGDTLLSPLKDVGKWILYGGLIIGGIYIVGKLLGSKKK